MSLLRATTKYGASACITFLYGTVIYRKLTGKKATRAVSDGQVAIAAAVMMSLTLIATLS